mgnify:CR=1 FL=1
MKAIDPKKLERQLMLFAMDIFFEGTCYGEASMEQRMDNNFLGAFLQMSQIRKTGGTNHEYALPNTINLLLYFDNFPIVE